MTARRDQKTNGRERGRLARRSRAEADRAGGLGSHRRRPYVCCVRPGGEFRRSGREIWLALSSGSSELSLDPAAQLRAAPKSLWTAPLTTFPTDRNARPMKWTTAMAPCPIPLNGPIMKEA
jgi:hypothetical protein